MRGSPTGLLAVPWTTRGVTNTSTDAGNFTVPSNSHAVFSTF
ncbi:MAG TPA: hypothetical protein VII84_08210 [Acidimicrobiales bacterium]